MSIKAALRALNTVGERVSITNQDPSFHNLVQTGQPAVGIHKPRLIRGTVITAVRFDKGLVMAGDRLAVDGGGGVFSRDENKLADVQRNAVVGYAGLISFAQKVVEDLKFVCDNLSSIIKRDISILGKAKILRSVVDAHISASHWFNPYFDAVFEAIMGGCDKYNRAAIFSFDELGGIYSHQDFCAIGSGGPAAKTFLDDRFQVNLGIKEALGLALGAINVAGKAVITVSSRFDYPPPTAKIISYKGGTINVPESDIVRWRSDAAQYDIDHRFGRSEKKKAARRERGSLLRTARSNDRRKR